MKTTTLKERMNLEESEIFEDDAQEQQDPGMTDEELKVESLKIATNIAKLMSNVTPEDIVNIAETVAKFIKNEGEVSLETVADESSDDSESEDTEGDTEENFVTDDEESKEDTEESGEENTDTEENFEV